MNISEIGENSRIVTLSRKKRLKEVHWSKAGSEKRTNLRVGMNGDEAIAVHYHPVINELIKYNYEYTFEKKHTLRAVRPLVAIRRGDEMTSFGLEVWQRSSGVALWPLYSA